jgi:hypothetical protein
MKLEAVLSTPEVAEGIEQAKMSKIQVDTDGKSFRLHKEF